MDAQLLDYITKARQAGMPEEQIRQTLLNVGWPAKDVAEAFGANAFMPTAAGNAVPSQAVPIEQGSRIEPVSRPASMPTQPVTADTSPARPAAARKRFPLKLAIGIVVLALVLGGGYFAYGKYGLPAQVRGVWEKVASVIPFLPSKHEPSILPLPAEISSVSPTATPMPFSIGTGSAFPATAGLAKFSSAEEFKAYLQHASQGAGLGGGFFGAGAMMEKAIPMSAPSAQGMSRDSAAAPPVPAAPDRVSQTNVQVEGIDEPDIVKTDGKEIYFSQKFVAYPVMYEGGVRPMPPVQEDVVAQSTAGQSGVVQPGIVAPQPPIPAKNSAEIKIFKAFPPAELIRRAGINKTGSLLLSKNVLVILPNEQYGYYGYDTKEARAVSGYDVSDPQNPKEAWKLELKDATAVTDARLFNGKLYLVTRTGLAYDNPCPVIPLALKGSSISISCIEIYHPIGNVPVDATYTAMAINPADGKIENRVSFVSPSYQTIVYMSSNALYLTYPLPVNVVGIYYGFFKEKGADLIPASFLERLRKLQDYDISDASKMTELMLVLQQYQAGLSADERLKAENELTNRAKDYFTEHAREMQKTAIVKIDLTKFSIAAQGAISGTPLNQFSLDEYKNYLRIATTIDGQNGFWGYGFGGSGTQSANDVYVLDADLHVVGSVQDLGITERIYSARFVEDRGYLVTFRQTDPFYVLDMSVPASPRKVGELKIPGYSSYLHPIGDDLVLGVGQEGSQVKLSLFDLTNPASPVEKDKYNLNEYWTQVTQTHHAFLLDTKHRVFFMPGSKGGYVFSYADNKLKLVATLADVSAERALYINDYLYIVADNKITVFNETDWTQAAKLEY